MKAAYWTAFGTMLIPIGVALLLGKSELGELAFWMIVAGFASFVAGWYYTIKEERRQDELEKRRQEEYKRRQEEYRLNIREGKTTILILMNIAEALGVDTNKVIKDQKELLDGE